MLSFLLPTLSSHISSHNQSKHIQRSGYQRFVRQGDSKQISHSSKDRQPCLLDGANDWDVLVDFDSSRITFPPEIYSTPLRPDIIIWSVSLHLVILCELTCPAEDGILAARIRKKARYKDLLDAINNDNSSPWSAKLFTIEAGARGFVGHSVRVFLRKLGLSSPVCRKACNAISTIVAKCSYTIYLSRDQKNWNRNRALLGHAPVEVTPASEQPDPSSGVSCVPPAKVAQAEVLVQPLTPAHLVDIPAVASAAPLVDTPLMASVREKLEQRKKHFNYRYRSKVLSNIENFLSRPRLQSIEEADVMASVREKLDHGKNHFNCRYGRKVQSNLENFHSRPRLQSIEEADD